MSIAETQGEQIVICTRQRLQLKSGGLDASMVAVAVGDSLRTSCLNEQKSPPSRYNKQLGCVEKVDREENPNCGYVIEADEEALALSYLCTKPDGLCARRETLARTTAELINRVAVNCVPREESIG